MVRLDRNWISTQFSKFAVAVRVAKDVPIFINQWEAVHGLTREHGRYDYISDVASLALEMDLGWAWWTWAGGNDNGWAGGSSEVVFRFPNGTMMVDKEVISALAPFMAGGGGK
jgi:hypothetical protein